MSNFLALCGHKNSGKTLLGTFIVNSLSQKGFKVGVIKSSHHEEITTDSPSKDTWLYREKGAFLTSLFQPNFFTLYFGKPYLNFYQEKDLFTLWESLFWDCDLILIEGFKNLENIPKLWCLKENENPEEIKKNLKNLLGFVVKNNSKNFQTLYPGEIFFSLEKKDQILNFIEKNIISKEKNIFLKINHVKIPLNSFVQNILKSTLEGFLKALKKVPENIVQVEIKVKNS